MMNQLLSAVLLLFALPAALSSSIEGTGKNFNELVHESGKNAFVMFRAPWCGHCKRMKPDWDKLGSEFQNSEHVNIMHVDCTTDDGKKLCSQHGVRGYPTIKYFDGSDRQGSKYEGGRSLSDLKKFTEENLGPSCDVANIELCSDEQKAFIAEWQAKSVAEVASEIAMHEEKLAESTKSVEALLEKLRLEFEEATEAHEKLEAELSGPLKLLKAVHAGHGTNDEL